MDRIHEQVSELWQMLAKYEEWPMWKYWVGFGGMVLLSILKLWEHQLEGTDAGFDVIFMPFVMGMLVCFGVFMRRIAHKFRLLRDSLVEANIYGSTISKNARGAD